ncbi:flagellar hook-associated protein FlgL [Candidatus Latescibacterota bacterium]
MRITDKILNTNFITNLAFSSERLFESETKVLTQKRVNKPSDDPVDALNSLALRTRIDEIEQYKRNISRTKTMLQNTESIVTAIAEIFQRTNSLTVQGASDSFTDVDKISVSYEINQLLEQTFKEANNSISSSYIFAGTNIDTLPYSAQRNIDGEIISITTSGTGGNLNRAIGENISIKANINGEDLFESGENLFDILIKIRNDLRANDSNALNQDLGNLDNAMEKIFNTQSVIGSRVNRVELAEHRAESDIVNFSQFLSNAEDIDAAQAIIDYQTELVTLQASLQAGSRLIQPKLLDFLR